ncbi:thioredoxin family protein [Candidatus Woesearchaeota archaeon]|nr:thioredoxin family protein [Candidatus Woesearchaeota archaeon]
MALLKSEAKKLVEGDSAPDFSLRNVDGKIASLKHFKGKLLVIIFMCNHCPYVKPKMDEIAKIQDDYAKKGVVVIGINSNDPSNYPEDDFEHMQSIAMVKGYAYYLSDETQETAKAYGATCTPDPFVFDKNHQLIYHGRINNAMNPGDFPTKHELREALDKVLAGKKIEEWFVPSMGCSIKWR